MAAVTSIMLCCLGVTPFLTGRNACIYDDFRSIGTTEYYLVLASTGCVKITVGNNTIILAHTSHSKYISLFNNSSVPKITAELLLVL